MNDSEIFDLLNDVIDRLNAVRGTHIILVEGKNDIRALEAVGVKGDFHCIQSTGGPLKAAEYVWSQGKQAVILTDWDRKGGIIARDLRENLASLDVKYDDRIRADMAFCCRPYAKDVESLDKVYSMIQQKA